MEVLSETTHIINSSDFFNTYTCVYLVGFFQRKKLSLYKLQGFLFVSLYNVQGYFFVEKSEIFRIVINYYLAELSRKPNITPFVIP